MTVEIKAPTFPESVADGVVAAWHKQPGEAVARDELLVEIETDKVVMEVVAPEAGVLSAVLIEAGETIASETLLATLTPGEVSVSTVTDASAAFADATHDADVNSAGAIPMGPAVRALLDEHGLSPDAISATGKGGRLLKEDVLGYLKGNESARQPDNVTEPAERQRATDAPISADVPTSERVEKRVPMTRMRARIAERLLGATQQTAMLTTFNEVNMAPLMKLRKQ